MHSQHSEMQYKDEVQGKELEAINGVSVYLWTIIPKASNNSSCSGRKMWNHRRLSSLYWIYTLSSLFVVLVRCMTSGTINFKINFHSSLNTRKKSLLRVEKYFEVIGCILALDKHNPHNPKNSVMFSWCLTK
ncbi:CLUMA_CG002166, isoform A [Clunio marinus]|uniref:CLUMA_CG002166, isoform A n=1 Tax=Clunio marinus TaxID=568069 RepID=A0A1J1HK37_9DIPT|nr:CLUMA_CG002166, isoform A [Clunio marinus]